MNDYFSLYENCTLCPRKCKVNRLGGFSGVCGESSELFVSRAALHMWEEPCISGANGSGAVFFSGCDLHCVYCQNHDISAGNSGKLISKDRLAEIFLELQAQNANNINLVTPTHFLPHILYAVKKAKEKGLKLPFVYNTSGYESVRSLSLLDGVIDTFLPDFKYFKSETAGLYSNVPDYPDVCKQAIKKMVDLTGAPQFDEHGLIKKGVIVRVLVLPLHTKESMDIIRYLYSEYGDDIYISIMSQYTPIPDIIPEGDEYSCLKRAITAREYEKVVDFALSLGIKNAYIQEGKVNLESFIPPFDNTGV